MDDATLVYDDDCGFCTWCADFVANRSDVEPVGFSELSADLRDRLPDDYEACAHLVTADEVYSCGAAVEQAIARTHLDAEGRQVVDFLREFEDYERLRERAYRLAADNRDVLGLLASKTPPAGANDDG